MRRRIDNEGIGLIQQVRCLVEAARLHQKITQPAYSLLVTIPSRTIVDAGIRSPRRERASPRMKDHLPRRPCNHAVR